MNVNRVAPEQQRRNRAAAVAEAGGVEQALQRGTLPAQVELTLAEALVLGLLRQGVRRFVGVLGHGSTELGDALRYYEEAGVCRFYNVRHETAAAHAATALRWVTGEQAVVVTSIGPGALQALAGSLAAASDGLGVWHLYGDETTEDEGPNMQQIPKHEQGLFLKLCSVLGRAYTLHTPLALAAALQAGRATVSHPYRPGPFYLLLPMNTQPVVTEFNLHELPPAHQLRPGPAAAGPTLDKAVAALRRARRVVVKLGRGARDAGPELAEFLELVDGVAVHTPIATGIIPYANPRNMTVGGSKGSICGNYAMEHADLLVAVGTRFVCQSDSSRTGYLQLGQVITIDSDPETATHYGRNLPLVGDAAQVLRQLIDRLRAGGDGPGPSAPSAWLAACQEQRRAWEAYKQARIEQPRLYDAQWGREVLTQPAAIRVVTDWAREREAVTFFDAGDVQANGFQLVEDDRPGRTCTETGASYMGFAASALLATALAETPFFGVALTGDGSFTMNPQILIDGAHHGAKGVIVLLDNRRMAAISGLQVAQYQAEYATADGVPVDYLAWARAVPGVLAIDGGCTPEALRAALEQAHAHAGLSLIHVPVYYGPDPLGGLGAFGRWNVGNWVAETQALRHRIGV